MAVWEIRPHYDPLMHGTKVMIVEPLESDPAKCVVVCEVWKTDDAISNIKADPKAQANILAILAAGAR